MEPNAGLVSALVPLLFLVVLELSRIAREIDIDEIVRENHGLFLFDEEDSVARAVRPRLGRFNFIHATNSTLLSIGLLVIGSSTGNNTFLLGFMTWGVWALLPIFEVDEYDQLLANDISNFSFHTHFIFATIATIYLGLYDTIVASIPKPPISLLDSDSIAFSILVVILYSGGHLFLNLLESEIENLEESKQSHQESFPWFQ